MYPIKLLETVYRQQQSPVTFQAKKTRHSQANQNTRVVSVGNRNFNCLRDQVLRTSIKTG